MKTICILTALLSAWMLTCVQAQEGDLVCFNIFLFSNATLARCQSEYIQFLSGTMSADNFCSECAQPLAQINQDCGHFTTASQIVSGCAQDTMGRFCGDLIRNETFLNSSVINIITACSGVSDCSGTCRNTVENAGCCLNNIPNITLPIDACNLDECTPSISLNIPAMNPQACFSSTVAANSVLTQCYQDFISAAVMAMGNAAPTREFCSGEVCPGMVSRAFATCGLTAHSTLIQKGCSLDEMNRYCGNVVDPLITPQWRLNVTAATTACAGTDCTDSPCQTAINNLGCCIAFGVEVGGTELPLTQCDVDFCPTTFTLDDGATAIPSPSMVTLAILLLAMAYFVV